MKIIILSLLLICNSVLAQNPEPQPVQPPATVPVLDPATNSATAPGGEGTAPGPELKKEFIYNESEGRDPFKVYRDPTVIVNDKSNSENHQTEQKSDNKLLARNIKTISVPNEVILLGIVYNKDNPVAAIKVLDGKTYYMRKNDLIGRHEGKIVEITRNTVLIEQYREFDGQKNLEKVVLKFKKNEQN